MKKIVLTLVSIVAFFGLTEAQNSVSLSAVTIEPGGTATLNIDVANAVEFTAFALTLNLPDGITIAEALNEDDELAPEVALTSRKKSDHTLSVNASNGKMASFSATNKLFRDQSGTLVTATLKANASFKGGLISVTEAYITDVTGTDYPMADALSVASVEGEITVPFTMTSAGWGTLIIPFDHNVPDGLTAYTCSSFTTTAGVNWLTLAKVSSLSANTPYILAGTTGNYNFSGTPNVTNTTYKEGLLTGVYAPTTIGEGSVLQNQDGEVAFYSVAASDPKAVPAYRCYLNSSAPSGSVAFRLGGTTGIEELTENESDGVLYDLQGRSVCGPLKNGVYIRNGKMILVK